PFAQFAGTVSAWLVRGANEKPTGWITGAPNSTASKSGCGLRPNVRRQSKRLVGALLEFDGHENHVLVAEVLEIVHLELTGGIGLVTGLTRLIGVLDGRAVMHVLTAASAVHRGPEIVEHV